MDTKKINIPMLKKERSNNNMIYSQTPLFRPSLIRLNSSPAKNGWEQIFLY